MSKLDMVCGMVLLFSITLCGVICELHDENMVQNTLTEQILASPRQFDEGFRANKNSVENPLPPDLVDYPNSNYLVDEELHHSPNYPQIIKNNIEKRSANDWFSYGDKDEDYPQLNFDVQKVQDKIVETGSSVVSSIAENSQSFIGKFKDKISSAADYLIPQAANTFNKHVSDPINKGINSVKDSLKDAKETSLKYVKEKIQNKIDESDLPVNNFQKGINDISKNLTQVAHSKWFIAGSWTIGIAALLIIFSIILIKIRKNSKYRTLQAIKKITSPGGQPYEALGNEV